MMSPSPLQTLAMAPISVFLILCLCSFAAAVPTFGDVDFSLPSTSVKTFNITGDTTSSYYKANAEQTAPDCPAEVIHHTRIFAHPNVTDTYVVPHSAIYMNGVPCGQKLESDKAEYDSGRYLWVVPGKFLAEKPRAESAGVANAYTVLTSIQRAFLAFIQLQSIDDVVVGVEQYSDRICDVQAALGYPRSSVFLFIRSDKDDLNFTSSAYLYQGESGLVTFKPDSTACIMKNSRKEGPQQNPFPALPPFPTQSFVAPPTPSPSLSPSPKPSPSASTSPRPSNSTVTGNSSTVASPTSSTNGSSGGSIFDAPLDASPSPSEEAACFPGSTIIQLKNGDDKAMSQLRVGDEVKVGYNEYSEVVMFTHRLQNPAFNFVQLETENARRLSLSAGHYLYVDGRLQTASSVELGQSLEIDNGEVERVVSKKVTTEMGLYHPQTLSGTIVVNGIIASTYSTAVHPKVARVLLAPVNFMYKYNLLPSRLGSLFEETSHGLDRLVPKGSQVVHLR
eukprot:Plantae.Rhodophyta-Hildenbrandia_rubra.ctg13595.p1 GENE.Plantae.Rhodophyta-Hildenbrandia_rubra.ctg13595~~Plantae.Rhodophyta-Hildenbrandia_rubra.ctg13595.p1  ORF type:complete len:506 (+),score=43.51 Plantae.Rhodophyta-Hildenbrandia_rubra.ctg13595:1377-2894(+)